MEFEKVESDLFKDIKVIERSSQRTEIKFYSRHAWAVNFIAFLIIFKFLFFLAFSAFIFFIISGFVFGKAGFEFGGYGLILFLTSLATTIYLMRKTKNWFSSKFHMIVIPEAVTMNGKHYDRKEWGGFYPAITSKATTGDFRIGTTQVAFKYCGVEHYTTCHFDHVRADNGVIMLNRLVEEVSMLR